MSVNAKKESSRLLYEKRIKLAIDYIQENLSEPISLSDVAKASCFSEFHFHRLFHGLVGETVSEFVTRKRMERAAHWIICKPEVTITDISLNGGYSSAANFSKSFKLYFGLSPSQLRDVDKAEISKNGKLLRKYGKAFNPLDLYSQSITNQVRFDQKDLEKMFMNIQVETLQEKRIAYLTAPGGYDLTSVFETWDKIIAWAKRNEIQNEQDKRYAICHDNPMITPTEKCRYDASIEVPEGLQVKAPFSVSNIPQGRYAIAYYKGAGDKVSDFYMELYSGWMPDSGFEPDDYPPVAHYLNDSRVDGYVEMEVQIKIKSV